MSLERTEKQEIRQILTSERTQPHWVVTMLPLQPQLGSEGTTQGSGETEEFEEELEQLKRELGRG